MGRMFNLPHPGETLREDVLPELGLTVTHAATKLGINRVTLSRVLNGKAGVRIDLALRLEAWLDGPRLQKAGRRGNWPMTCGRQSSIGWWVASDTHR